MLPGQNFFIFGELTIFVTLWTSWIEECRLEANVPRIQKCRLEANVAGVPECRRDFSHVDLRLLQRGFRVPNIARTDLRVRLTLPGIQPGLL